MCRGWQITQVLCNLINNASDAVAAVSASSGARPYIDAAIAMASGMEQIGEVPGLQSVAMAIGTPASRSNWTGGLQVSWSA